ncbi:MAG: hypothetical protein RLZZ543_2231 [Bacteroidota bacterium]|jgi:hypothetical protein
MLRFLYCLFAFFFLLTATLSAQNTSCGQTITDAQGEGAFYLPSTIQIDTFSVAQGEAIYLDFSQLSLANGDTLRYFDGALGVLLAQFTAGDTIHPVQSYGSSLVQSFSSDTSEETEGWLAQVLCVPSVFLELNFTNDSLCAGWEGFISFSTLTNLPDSAVIEVLLSDAFGDLSNAQPIGEAYAGDSTVFISLAADLPAGAGYIMQFQLSDSTGILISQSRLVKISRLPLLPTLSGPNLFCGETLVLTSSTQNDVTLQWLYNGDVLGDSTNAQLFTHLEGTYAVQADNNCGTVFSENHVLQLLSIPTIPQLTSDATIICLGDTSAIALVSDADTSAFTWYQGGQALSDTSSTLLVTTGGDYYLSRSNFCGTSVSDTIQLTGLSAPAAPIISANGALNFCESGSVTFSISDNGNDDIHWFQGSTSLQTGGSTFTANQAGFYHVELSNVCGTSVSEDTLEVQVQLNPTPASVSAAGPTTLCVGNSVLLLADVAPGLQTQWLINGQPANEPSLQISADVSGVYSINTSNSCGTVASVNSIPVIINPLPSVPNMFNIGTPALCNGSSVTLAVEAQTGVTYEWKRNGSVFSGTTNSITTTTDGVYTVTVSNGCGSMQSANTISVITGNSPLTPSISAGGATSFCQGGSVTLTTPPQQGVLYRWLLNGAPVGGTSFSYAATQAGNYTVEVSNACDTLVSSSFIQVNTLHPPVQVQVSPIGEYNLCEGDSMTLSIPNIFGVSFQWKRNNQVLPFNSNSITISQEGSYTIVLANTCGMTPASNSVFLNIDSIQPGASSIVAQPSTDLCLGGYVLLNATQVPFQLYHWYLNGELIQGEQNAVLQATEWGTYTLQTNNACGLSDTSSGVTLGPGDPPSDFNLYLTTDSVFCSNDSIPLTAQTSFGVSVRWYLNDELLVEGPSQIYAHQPGVYTANCWNGCGEATGLNSLTVNTIPAPPVPQISLADPSLTTSAVGAIQWLDANFAPIAGATSQSFTPEPVNASYFVQVTAPNGCSEISEAFHYNVDGVEEIDRTCWEIYPNPAKEYFYLNNTGPATQLQLRDITGRQLSSYIIPAKTRISISRTDLPSGVYLIGNAAHWKRLVIE